MKCILPYSECVYYLLENGNCQDDGLDAPYNGDAKCHRISGKKKMLTRAKVASPTYIYPPLEIKTYHQNLRPHKVLRVYIGEKSVAHLKYIEGIWHLANEYENPIPMGNNELDAVETALHYLEYTT